MTDPRCATENELLEYAEGLLDAPARSWVEEHLDTCLDCSEALAEFWRRTGSAPAGGEEAAPGSSLYDALVDGSAYGYRFGRYVLLERLGEGAMGIVYTAHDPKLARTVALKLVRPAVDRGEARARLLREAQVAARLKHANVVTVHEAGEAAGLAYIALEYVKGETVRAWMRTPGRPRPWREVLRVFLQAGEGLAAAHRAGVVHRDFKPANILLDEEGRARVADFGLAIGARETSEEETLQGLGCDESHDMRMTRTGALLGTPLYMAPEQHEDADVDARADQYSFAASLYEALYGAHPFAGATLKEQLAAKKALAVHEGRSARVPGWLRAVVLRGLHPDPSARWPDMGAMLAALRADPTRRRWLTAAAVSAVVGATTAFGVRAHTRAEIAAACEAEGMEIRATWSDDRVSRMKASFLATGLAFAADSWERGSREVDAYVTTFAASREAMCRAGELEGSIAPRVLARARECFDEARTAVETLASAWESADALVVTRATMSASSLPRLGWCGSVEALQRRLSVEAPHAEPQTLNALQAELREARARAHEGKHAEAVGLAEQVERQALELGARSLASRASLTHCNALQQLSDHEGAFAACVRSFRQSVESSDHEGAVHAAAALAGISGQTRHHRRLAEVFLDLAESHSVHIDGAAGERARLHSARGYLAQDFGEPAAAIAEFRAAIAIYDEAYGEHLDMTSYLWTSIAHLSLEVLDPPDLEGAREAIERAAAIREAVYGPDHSMTFEVERYRALLELKTDRAQANRRFEALFERMSAARGAAHPGVLSYLGDWRLRAWENCARSQAEASAVIARLDDSTASASPWLPPLLTHVGRCHLEAGDPEAARSAAERVMTLLAADDGPEAAPLRDEARALAADAEAAKKGPRAD